MGRSVGLVVSSPQSGAIGRSLDENHITHGHLQRLFDLERQVFDVRESFCSSARCG